MRALLGGVIPLLVLLAWFGCGHEVEPTQDYEDPADIPLCCESDPDPSCCAVIAFAFVGGIQLSWNAEDEIFRYVDGWNVYRAQGETSPADSAYHRLNGSLILFRDYLDEEIVDGVRYWYRLTSVTPATIESLPTHEVSVRADFSAPAPPEGLFASVSNLQVALNWQASSEADLDHYNVYRDPAFPPFVFPRAPDPMYVDVQVAADSTYRYWVTAVDVGLNESAPSETVAVTLPGARRFP